MHTLPDGLLNPVGAFPQRIQDLCTVKNTFLEFHDESTTHAASMREPRSCSEPPLRLTATTNDLSWSRQATPELDFTRSITEPVSRQSQHHVALHSTEPQLFGVGNRGGGDIEPLKECMKTSDCLSPGCQRQAGFGDCNLAEGINDSFFEPETFVGGALPGTGNHHGNLVDNQASAPYQKGSCDNSAYEWNGLGMDKLSLCHAPDRINMQCSNMGNNQSTARGDSKHEHVDVHDPAASSHTDLWGPDITTVMIRRIPRRFTQQMLVAEVVSHGFGGYFNFLYLPWERKQNTNMGYAFMNFVYPKGAMEFKEVFDGLCLNSEMEMKSRPLRVHPAAVQGYQANRWHFMRTKVGQNQDSNYSPIFLEHHSIEQKEIAGQWHYQDSGRRYHQASALQKEAFTKETVFGRSSFVQQQSAKKLRGRQTRAPAASRQ